MTDTTPPAGHDIPTRALAIALAVVAVGALVYFAAIKPVVHDHTLEVRHARRAACSLVPPETAAAIRAALHDTDGREIRALRAMPSEDGWWMVSADLARPGVPRGFTGELTTWRVRTDSELGIESVDRNARELSSFPPAPADVSVTSVGGFDSRWCAKDAGLNATRSTRS